VLIVEVINIPLRIVQKRGLDQLIISTCAVLIVERKTTKLKLVIKHGLVMQRVHGTPKALQTISFLIKKRNRRDHNGYHCHTHKTSS